MKRKKEKKKRYEGDKTRAKLIKRRQLSCLLRYTNIANKLCSTRDYYQMLRGRPDNIVPRKVSAGVSVSANGSPWL